MDHFSLPIPKFSHATSTSTSSSSAAWTHITSSPSHPSLKADFYIQSPGGLSQKRHTLRISRHQEILENLDLNWLARTHEMSCFMSIGSGTVNAAGSGIQNGKSPIAVIVKSPCIAVRYQTGQQTRRFQIKFGSDEDYAKAVSILADAGCPITESLSIQKQSQLKSQSSLPQLDQHTQSSVPNPALSLDPFENQGQGQSQLPILMSPSLTMGAVSSPASTAPPGCPNPNPVSTLCSPIKPSWQTGGLSLSTSSVNAQSPPSALLWQTRNENDQRPITHGGYPQPGYVSNDVSTLSTPIAGNHENGGDAGCFQPGTARPSTAPVSNRNRLSMPPPPLPSCTTMPTPQKPMDMADHDVLPPRRELPFLSARNGSGNASLISKSDANGTLPTDAKNIKKSQKPRISPLGAGKKSLGVKSNQLPAKQRAVAEKPFKSPVKRRQTKGQALPQAVAETTTSPNPSPIQLAETATERAHGSAITMRDGSDRNGHGTLPVAPARLADMPDQTIGSGVKESGVSFLPQSSQNQVVTSPAINNNVVVPALQPTSPASIAYCVKCAAEPTASSLPLIAVGRQALERNEEQITLTPSEGGVFAEQTNAGANPLNAPAERLTTPKNDNRVSSSLTSDLKAYMATPTPERIAALESWVCTQLESEEFLKLCEDVEGVWRRIGYGF